METLKTVIIVLTFLSMLIGLSTIIYKMGQNNERAENRFNNIDKTMESFIKHMELKDIHLNPELQAHIAEENRAWRTSVDNKLSLLLANSPSIFNKEQHG